MDWELAIGWMYTLLKTLSLLTSVTLVACWVWYQFSRRRMISLAKTVPVMEPVVPLLGHLLGAIMNPRSFSSKFILNMLTKAADKGLDVFCVWAGPIPLVFVQKPEDVQIIFTRPSTQNKGFFYTLVEFAIGSGLLVGPVNRWKIIRRHLLPIFHGSNLEHMVPSSNDRGRDIVQLLRERCSQSPVDILPLMRVPTFVNVCSLIFGADASTMLPMDPTFHQRVVNVIMRTLELWSIRFVFPWLYSDRIFKLLFRKDVKELEDVSKCVSANAVQVLKEKMTMEQYEETSGKDGTGQCTILDAFISLKKADPSFNEQNFRQEILTIGAAGTNSAAVSISSFILALAWHPEVQEKLHAEIVSVLGHDLNRDVTTEDIKNMPYLDQALRETWRRFTVFPYNQRKTTEDLQLSFGVVPAGASIQVGMLGVHMNPNIYPDPYKFDPERFSAENMSKRHKFTLLPFSGGPRNCIAMAYATQFIKIAIIHVVREFTLHTNADMGRATFKYLIEAQRENGYPIWVRKRSY